MRLGFILKESLSGYKRYKISFFLTVFSIFIALSLLGFFAYVFINAQLLLQNIKNRVEIEAFLYNYVSDSQADSLKKVILNIEGITEVDYISKNEAKQRFIKETGLDFYEVLTYNPLPASFTIELAPSHLNKEFIDSLKKYLLNTKLISDVVYNHEFLDEVESRTATFQKILVLIFSVVTIATILLISNTIRLALNNKIDVINTMRLVGATHLFIQLPFLFEGIIFGFVAGIFSSIFLYVMHLVLQKIVIVELLITNEVFVYILVSLVIFGILLGFLGSFFTIKKFLRQSAFPK